MEDYGIQVTNRDALDIMTESGPEDMVLLDVPYLAGRMRSAAKREAYGAYDWAESCMSSFSTEQIRPPERC